MTRVDLVTRGIGMRRNGVAAVNSDVRRAGWPGEKMIE